MKIIDLGINGEGVAKENGKVYFIKGALIGEDVSVNIVKDKNNFCQAVVNKINNISEDRVLPFCPHFEKCGGCNLQHLVYSKQLEFKQKLVKDTLKKILGISFDVQKTEPSKTQYEYRNKNVFPIFEKDNRTCIGMFEEDSHKCLEIKECKIANIEINKVLNITSKFLENKKSEGAKYLVIRSINKDTLITLVTENKNLSYLKDYVEELRNNSINFSLNLNMYENSEVILSNKFINIFGKNYLENDEFGIKYKINSGSFLQVNDDVKKSLYQEILEQFMNKDIVVDAYCGAGLLSAMIANKTKFCYGIEICKQAIDSANVLQRENNIKNLMFICGDCKEELPKILPNIEDNFNIVLDPPRKGCSVEVLQSVIDTKPQKIIYVSCNPITLTKDLRVLLKDTYMIKYIKPFDMFPNTTNVETLVVLEKR